MNPLLEMMDVLVGNIIPGPDDALHIGVKRRSGRYPWGSGKDPYQHSGDFLSRVTELKAAGMSEAELCEHFGLSSGQLRTQLQAAKNERQELLRDRAKSLREDGKSLREIAAIMGYANDSSVRALLNEDTTARKAQAKTTADVLEKLVNEKGMLDVGEGVALELGISQEKLNEALYLLELRGYNTYSGRYEQVTNPGKFTTMKVLCPPDIVAKEDKNAPAEIFNPDNIHSVRDYLITHDDGESYHKPFEYPSSMDSSRLAIRYAEDGGIDKDGVIEIRRGVKDLSLGDSHYAQVRILVDGDRYLKGMAVYSDDLPDGVDVMFNTNKTSGTPMRDVLKKIKDDPSNPFGALIKEHGGQSYYVDDDGTEKLSLINKKSDEGDWGEWAKKVPSQFLSKQSEKLIKTQLGLTIADAQEEFDEIRSLTNPTVKKKLLMSFADDCDAAAVHLKATALPRQLYQVILPLTTIKDNEVYAPNYQDGEEVALIRYPHGGTFEIPILKVNNKVSEGKSVIGTAAKDAVGIAKSVADRLSGADFDGDTVMVIPLTKSLRITSTEPLKGLEGFDPKMEYSTTEKDGNYYNAAGKKIKPMSKSYTQTEMGVASNLITDMTIKGATPSELARAVRYSMVVIDAEKHKLDYKTAYKDNGIAELKEKYQGHIKEDGTYAEGASTLISRAKSEQQVLKRQGSAKINVKGADWYDETKPEGSLVYKTADDLEYTDKKGNTKLRTQKSTRMAETDDAYTLVSDYNSPQERLYAAYANARKSLANQARLEYLATGKIEYNAKAKKAYQEEVDSLDAKLKTAELNAPRERQAQILANSKIKATVQEYPDLLDKNNKSELKKLKQRTLSEARVAVGAKRNPIEITDKEWDAIQAGAISDSKLSSILDHTDIDKVKERATPRKASNTLNATKRNLIKTMKAAGYTTDDIAKRLNVSTSTVTKYM